jgi:hypothetical protein
MHAQDALLFDAKIPPLNFSEPIDFFFWLLRRGQDVSVTPALAMCMLRMHYTLLLFFLLHNVWGMCSCFACFLVNQCPHGGFTSATTPSDQIQCFWCDNKLPKGCKTFSCRQCSLDVCEPCVQVHWPFDAFQSQNDTNVLWSIFDGAHIFDYMGTHRG